METNPISFKKPVIRAGQFYTKQDAKFIVFVDNNYNTYDSAKEAEEAARRYRANGYKAFIVTSESPLLLNA